MQIEQRLTWGLTKWSKNVLFHKGTQQCDKKQSGKGNGLLLAWSHSSNGCTMYIYYNNALLLITVSKIFTQWDSAVISWFTSWGSALFNALHTSLLAIQRLGTRGSPLSAYWPIFFYTSSGETGGVCSYSEHCYTKFRSHICTWQSADCPHLYLVHNVYAYF